VEIPNRDLRAVLLDMDGTLYRQGPLRLRMAVELAARAISSPCEAFRAARVIRSFRSHRERLRHGGPPAAPRIELQYEESGAELGLHPSIVASVVAEWMERRPLRHLMACRRQGVVTFLECCRKRGLAVGVYSDYPTREKVEALGLSLFIDLHLCSTDREINAFKPSPAGILEACRRWGVAPGCLLYIGDRQEVDGEASRAAGVKFALLGRGRPGEAAARNFRELMRLLGWQDS
jgi:FMN phosphatase YigB (HAD superfamily)